MLSHPLLYSDALVSQGRAVPREASNPVAPLTPPPQPLFTLNLRCTSV